MKYALVVLFAMMSSGCAMWPKQGQGGWGENFLRHHDGNESTWYTQNYDNLKRDLEHLRLRLEIMRARGIEQCMPARLKLAKLMATRITRQLTANMYAQSEHDLGVFYHQINLLQVHFDDVQKHTGCGDSVSAAAMDVDIRSSIQNLLNSDNQFAFADDNLTPKYQQRIKQAAELLLSFDNTSILLIGHTDQVGEPQTNQDLGLARATKVKNALLEHGLNATNFTIVSQGESQPYSKGDSLAQRLSNRRVEAVVLSLGDSHDFSNPVVPLSHWTTHLQSGQE
ncbi:OmpA family protein [Aestuariibacter salexigens]|uniref:OmpA family protein n=1 Tax=Aestuariibacter salexigens TaxID=226010 RepID=UPI00040AF9CF|nr:OmpA family protein [Aestuariibacter salexigens]